jgi:hypothetical protein
MIKSSTLSPMRKLYQTRPRSRASMDTAIYTHGSITIHFPMMQLVRKGYIYPDPENTAATPRETAAMTGEDGMILTMTTPA